MPLIATAPGRALGQPGLTPPPPAASEPPRTRTHTYWEQLLIADGLMTALALGSERAEPIIGLLITGPLVHGLHGRGKAAVGSLMLRATLPVVGLVVGEETCNERPVGDDLGCLDNIFIGLGVALAVTLGLDYYALARETVTVTASPARVRPAITVTPTASSAGLRFDF